MSDLKKKAQLEKQEKLAEALRENLKRRKSQNRKNGTGKQPAPSGPAGQDS